MTRPNVLFVVIDTVRSDRVSSMGYERSTTPNFDRFAADATTYTDAVAQAAWSIPSHASLFTGKYPTDHGATSVGPILRDERYLPRLLANAGYETYAVSPNEYVRPSTGFGRGFDEFYTCTGQQVPPALAALYAPAINWGTRTPAVRMPIERRFNAMRVAQEPVTGRDAYRENHLVAHVADVLERASSPFFLFANVIDAHLPRSPRRRFYEEFVDDDLDEVRVVENERAHTWGEGMSERQIRKMTQLYDADLRTMDEKLGELLDLFERVGVLDTSLVVLVSDHGEHLGEFGQIGHQNSLYDPVVSVPMAIRFPDGTVETVSDQVEIRRLFHTVLDETGVQSHPSRSLASGAADDVARGEFVSPMVDVEALVDEGKATYDRSLMGEVLAYRRDGTEKLVTFGDAEWRYDLPDHES